MPSSIHATQPISFGDLAGACALKLATALLVKRHDLLMLPLLHYCDLVSLTDENRVIVASGLDQMKQPSG